VNYKTRRVTILALGWESWMGTLKKDKAANLIALDSYPFDDLHLLAEKKHWRFVMKDGRSRPAMQIMTCLGIISEEIPFD
jgi:hypothetical protein